jgi:hypothetical protein
LAFSYVRETRQGCRNLEKLLGHGDLKDEDRGGDGDDDEEEKEEMPG